MGTLTLSMIVKNEEKYLKECIDSVADIVDEIVIVDTGSTDQTKDIASRYKAKIYDFAWIDDFSAARNFALKHSTSKWILYLDADERLDEKSNVILKQIIQHDELLAVNCKVKSINNLTGTPSFMKYTRLFRNSDSIHFEGKVHEQIERSLKLNGYMFIDSDIEINHLGYDVEESIIIKKAERNYNLLLREYEQNPSPYNAFQLGQTCIALNKKKEAVLYLESASVSKQLESSHRAHCFRYLAAYNYEHGNYSQAIELINKGLQISKTVPLLYVVAANIHIMTGDFKKAKEECLNAYQYNIQHLENQIKVLYEITISNDKMLLYGVNVAIIIADKDLFDFFFSKITFFERDSIDEKVCRFYHKMFNHENILVEEIPFNKVDPVVLLRNLIKYQNKRSLLNICKAVVEVYPNNTDLMVFCGEELSSDQKKEAVEIFKYLYKRDNTNPIYLLKIIELYSEMNDYESIKKIIESSKAAFINNSSIYKQLESIENKVSNIQ